MKYIQKEENWPLFIALIFSTISIGGIISKVPNATDAYLSAWAFWLQFPLGALAITLLHELTGGKWGTSARPVLLAMIKCLWIAPLLFLPLVLNMNQMYPWLQDKTLIHQNNILKFREMFYHMPFFVLRAFFYFIILLFISTRADNPKRGPYMAAWGLFLYVLIISLAAIDWFMSREPEWYSTIYSLIWIMSQVCSAFAVVLAVKIKSNNDDNQVNSDQGTLFFVFLIVWAYLSFMQFLIIWSGNLPQEVSWYLTRLNSGWQFLLLSIFLGSLVIPFFFLLNQKFKTQSQALALLAFLVLLCRFLDVSWMILPASREHFFFSYWDLISFIGIGSFSVFIFFKQLRAVNA